MINTIKLAQVFRDNLLESEHYGIVTLVNSVGELISAGDSDFTCFTRSLIKPIQAKVAKDILGDELNGELLAISIASHNSEPEQLALVNKLMSKFEVQENDLRCGTYKTSSYSLKSKIEHNCSAKHTALIAACKKQGWSLNDYTQIDHPIQKLILKELEDLLAESLGAFGIDGCGLPSFHMSLSKMTKIFAAMIVNPAYGEILQAMRDYPLIIGGKSQIDSLLMKNSKNLIAKGGAEGLMMIANLETKEVVLIKIIDGSHRVKAIVSKAMTEHLNWLEQDFILDNNILNSNKDVVGSYVACDLAQQVSTML
ncbi:MAG: hypothetical protein HOA17_06685 [Candidatus Melainabacteria bacterium]|jgi:L-asparaginase II|nr:hypothetical protein [Candidatus Melainabacteria bacterium]